MESREVISFSSVCSVLFRLFEIFAYLCENPSPLSSLVWTAELYSETDSSQRLNITNGEAKNDAYQGFFMCVFLDRPCPTENLLTVDRMAA